MLTRPNARDVEYFGKGPDEASKRGAQDANGDFQHEGCSISRQPTRSELSVVLLLSRELRSPKSHVDFTCPDAEKIVAPVVKDPSFGLEKGSDASARDGEEGGPAVDPAAGAPTDAGAGEGAGVGAEAVKQQAEAAASGPSNLTGSRSPLGDGAGIGTKNPVSPGTAVIKDGGEGNNGQHILSAGGAMLTILLLCRPH